MHMPEPSIDRPIMPAGYGIAKTKPKGAKWSPVLEQIAASKNYWICTTRDDGRPHAMPVWGVVVDDAFMFSTDPTSVKGRNLIARPAVVMHLESGDDVVVIEGTVERAPDSAVLTRFADAYKEKYEFRPDPDDPNGITFVVRPKVVLAWTEKDFPNSAVRWAF
jgi:PPOX class probable F420-dependent enzyme